MAKINTTNFMTTTINIIKLNLLALVPWSSRNLFIIWLMQISSLAQCLNYPITRSLYLLLQPKFYRESNPKSLSHLMFIMINSAPMHLKQYWGHTILGQLRKTLTKIISCRVNSLQETN